MHQARLWPVPAHAKFLIEFADGHRMTVNNYEENGNTVKVYTSLGSFAFQKNDIVNITDLDPGKKAKKSVSTAKAPPPPAPVKERVETPPVEHPAKAPASPTRESSPLEGVAAQIEDGLFRMRYVFALAAGAKALKIFFAASAR
ncbi:MAG: hypothetical protein FJ147_08180 [Deltaproteobacteria bacterium]|nr:hypothetical protein [Deltaproteobacteria bacterium]